MIGDAAVRMDIFLLLIRLLLAAVFLLAGIGKLLDRQGSEEALRSFDVPAPLVKPAAAVLPWAEIALAVILLFNSISWFGAIAGAALLAAFSAAMLRQISKGNAPDCHCFGQIHSEPVGARSLIRNGLFMLLALVLVISGPEAQGMDPRGRGAGTEIYGTDMGFILWAALTGLLVPIIFILKKISDQQSQIIRRLEILEVISAEGRELTRETLGDPNSGLPIGSPLPAFGVRKPGDRAARTDGMLTPGRPALLLFVGPGCHPCESLIPEIESWAREFGDRLDLLLISSGSDEENIGKFGSIEKVTLYIQNDRSVSDLLGALWTPTAILVDSKGAIASRNAVGDSAIMELMERLGQADLDDDYFYLANGAEGENLKIGEQVPEFALRDLDGQEITATRFLGKRTLAAFWSTTCPHCISMIEALREWNSTKGGDEPDLIVFSDGDPEQHRTLGLDAPIVLDKDYKHSAKIGMYGTPSGVLIDERGKIASETGVGAEMIWALLGKYEGAEKGTERDGSQRN